MKGDSPGKQRGALVSALLSEKGFWDGGSERALCTCKLREDLSLTVDLPFHFQSR